MNAMYFQVPQSRQRLIWLGAREGLIIEPGHPSVQNRPCSVRAAWNDIANPEDELIYAFDAIAKRRNSIAPILAKAVPGQQLSKLEPRGFYYNWQRLPWDGPAMTIPKEDINICHPVEQRIITPTECKRLMAFPDGFRLVGNIQERRYRVGNSVPPLFMRAIAQHIRRTILDERLTGMGLEARLTE